VLRIKLLLRLLIDSMLSGTPKTESSKRLPAYIADVLDLQGRKGMPLIAEPMGAGSSTLFTTDLSSRSQHMSKPSNVCNSQQQHSRTLPLSLVTVPLGVVAAAGSLIHQF
jgi:hypothetical protein